MMDLKMKKFITLKSIIPLYIIPYIFIFIALYFIGLIDKESKITFTSFGSGLGGLIVIIGLYFFYQRLEKQQKQIDIQINQRVDERFNSAINLLGSNETSARTGAIYALHELAIEEEKYRRQIAQILCSHIRSKTNEAEYKETHSKRPSNEIQTTIDLLFKEEGLYAQGFKGVAKPSKANLSHAYLMGADFRDAQCQGVDFKYAQCQKAVFRDVRCQEADFRNARCQKAVFFGARCQKADFMGARCQKADFRDVRCQEADFTNARCQRANFVGAKCWKADFMGARCQGANFGDAQCQEADFVGAECQGAVFAATECQKANFGDARCQGADFTNAQCQEANFVGAECQGADFEGAKFDRPHDIQIKGESVTKQSKPLKTPDLT
ncbi:hypothetical protein [uncultured Gammaproteobacteria bacterium]|jgi:uncharacterized protein YjbI with pentapeptide repeats|nr:hypothetical protein [uncultured Gammaproteobacteria bacterium]